MRFGLVVALLFSIILISVASWWRFGGMGRATPIIAGLEQVSGEDFYNNEEEIFKAFIGSASTTTAISEPLTKTDIITRKLLMSYLDTAMSGKGVVDANTINTIANHYVEETGDLHTFNSVSIQEISLVQDSETNARNYAKEFSKIYSNYTWEMTLLIRNPENTEALARAYENMSNSLKALPVPLSVSVLHLQLVNNHASTAAAIRSVNEMEADPIKTIAGMAAIKENVLKETSTLADIDRILREKYDTL